MQRHIVFEAVGIAILSLKRWRTVRMRCPWERGRPARNTPKAWVFRERHQRRILGTARPVGHERPARLGRSCDLNAVIPAQAGIQVSRGHGRPARKHGRERSAAEGPPQTMRAGRPRSQGRSFTDDPAPIAGPFGPGATAWRG